MLKYKTTYVLSLLTGITFVPKLVCVAYIKLCIRYFILWVIFTFIPPKNFFRRNFWCQGTYFPLKICSLSKYQECCMNLEAYLMATYKQVRVSSAMFPDNWKSGNLLRQQRVEGNIFQAGLLCLSTALPITILLPTGCFEHKLSSCPYWKYWNNMQKCSQSDCAIETSELAPDRRIIWKFQFIAVDTTDKGRSTFIMSKKCDALKTICKREEGQGRTSIPED